MTRIAMVLVAVVLTLAVPALADDIDGDGLDDACPAPPAATGSDGGMLAIFDTGNYTVDHFANRLTGLGYTVTIIPSSSGYSTFVQHDMVLLPVSHAGSSTYSLMNSLAQDFIDYVADGGCLYVAQPNPFDIPGSQAEITWVPYDLTVEFGYTVNDCPPSIVVPDHCITDGLIGADLPFPADTVMSMGPEWLVVVEGPYTGRPSVFTATYQQGAVLVELANPSYSSSCPYTDLGLDRMVSCMLASASSPVDDTTWGMLKALYR